MVTRIDSLLAAIVRKLKNYGATVQCRKRHGTAKSAEQKNRNYE